MWLPDGTLQAQAGRQEPWTRIWESRGGIWNVLTESAFKQFPLEQLARNWAAGKEVAA